jgi:hypothetical protein
MIIPKANNGRRRASTVHTKHAPASMVDTNGLPSPPVEAVDSARTPTVEIWTVPLVVPPTMMLSDHRKAGSSSPNDVDMSNIPPRIAAGEATVSRRLSNHGM